MAAHPGLTATTLATWVFVLHASGVRAAHEGIAALCDAVASASDTAAGEAAGLALVDGIAALLADDDPPTVRDAARALFGERLGDGLGEGDRAERTARIRRYQFDVGMPWLARIWERKEQEVAPHWVIVERLTDVVHAMDPNPWDDVDEERNLPLGDFQVLWELDACSAVHLASS